MYTNYKYQVPATPRSSESHIWWSRTDLRKMSLNYFDLWSLLFFALSLPFSIFIAFPLTFCFLHRPSTLDQHSANLATLSSHHDFTSAATINLASFQIAISTALSLLIIGATMSNTEETADWAASSVYDFTYLKFPQIEERIKAYESEPTAHSLNSLASFLLAFAFDPKDSNWPPQIGDVQIGRANYGFSASKILIATRD